jgi:hypothetical protein
MFRALWFRLLLIAIIDVTFIAFGVLASSGHLTFITADRGWLSMAMGVVAVVTFFGFLILGYISRDTLPFSESPLRVAISASTIVVYLTIVGIVSFYAPIEKDMKLHPMQEQMINSFTTVVGIVVAFFFGSSAYMSRRKDQSQEKNIPSQVNSVDS